MVSIVSILEFNTNYKGNDNLLGQTLAMHYNDGIKLRDIIQDEYNF